MGRTSGTAPQVLRLRNSPGRRLVRVAPQVGCTRRAFAFAQRSRVHGSRNSRLFGAAVTRRRHPHASRRRGSAALHDYRRLGSVPLPRIDPSSPMQHAPNMVSPEDRGANRVARSTTGPPFSDRKPPALGPQIPRPEPSPKLPTTWPLALTPYAKRARCAVRRAEIRHHTVLPKKRVMHLAARQVRPAHHFVGIVAPEGKPLLPPRVFKSIMCPPFQMNA